MNDTPGQMIKRWRDEFETNEELRFRFQIANAFIRHRLMELYQADQALRAEFRDFRSFERAAKKEASDLLLSQRTSEGRAKALAEYEGRKSTVTDFVQMVLRK